MTDGGLQQFCTFRVAHMHWGVEVERVQEVMLFQEMTRVPLMPEEVRGLINLRGQIVKAIDLRRRMGLPPAETGGDPLNVVLKTPDGAVALLVDDIGDVVTTYQDRQEKVPANMRHPVGELARGVHKLDGKLLLVLDAQKVQEPCGTVPGELVG